MTDTEPRAAAPVSSSSYERPDALDMDCRLMAECRPSDTRHAIDRDTLTALTEIFTNPKYIGMGRDMANTYIVHRPWLTKRPVADIRAVIEALCVLGVRGDRLFEFKNTAPRLLALGYASLAHVFSFLRKHRMDQLLPEDLNDLAIPKDIWEYRLAKLASVGIIPGDAAFAKALFAPTARGFLAAFPVPLAEAKVLSAPVAEPDPIDIPGIIKLREAGYDRLRIEGRGNATDVEAACRYHGPPTKAYRIASPYATVSGPIAEALKSAGWETRRFGRGNEVESGMHALWGRSVAPPVQEMPKIRIPLKTPVPRRR